MKPSLQVVREVLEWWPSYTGLPSRIRESEDPTEYTDGRCLLALNDDALAAIALVERELDEAREQLEDLRMKILKLATWYGHDEAAALGERWEPCENCGKLCPPAYDSLCAKCYRTVDDVAKATWIPRGDA